MKRYLYILLATAVVACSKEGSDATKLNIGEGRTAIVTSAENFVVQSETRAAGQFEIPAALLPTDDELAQYELRITGTYYTDGDNPVLTEFDETYESIEAYNSAEVDRKNPDLRTPPYLPAGDYVALITDKRDREAEGEGAEFGCFGGEMSFTIVAREYNATETITAKMENSLVRLHVTSDFERYFTSSKLVISTEGGEVFSTDFPLAADATERLLFVEAGTNLYFSGSATKQDPGNGSPATVTFNKSLLSDVATAGELTTVVVDAKSAAFFTVTVKVNNEVTNVHKESIDLNDSVE